GQPFQFIHPLGARHPVEIATSRVLQGGTLVLTIRELWNGPVWQQLAGLARSNNIVDIYEALARDPSYVTCTMIIKPPGTEGNPGAWRGKIFHNCVVVDINDGDTVTVGSQIGRASCRERGEACVVGRALQTTKREQGRAEH